MKAVLVRKADQVSLWWLGGSEYTVDLHRDGIRTTWSGPPALVRQAMASELCRPDAAPGAVAVFRDLTRIADSTARGAVT